MLPTSAIERPVEWMILIRLRAAGEPDQPLNIIRGKVRLPGSFVLSRRRPTTLPLPVADRRAVDAIMRVIRARAAFF